MTRGVNDYYYHAAALGTVTEITDNSGGLVERYTYDVYGEPKMWDSSGSPIATSQIGNRLLFQGRDRDPATSLYNFRNRYYSPGLGRFVQVDPIGQHGGLNFFLFAANSPQVLFDPYGLAASANDCEAACAAARKDLRINNGTSLGVVMCTGSGVKCPCLLGYKQFGFDIGDCPEIDKVILAHELGHINAGSSQCDPNNKNPHPARCNHSKAAHTQEECELKKKDINALREAARLSKGVCKGHANAVRASAELWYETYCK
jgi:RHS repeat-associated protein